MPINRKQLDPKILHELLEVNFNTGELVWKERGIHWFIPTKQRTAECQCKWWNNRFAGKQAGSYNREYLRLSILNMNFEAHRIIYVMYHNKWPELIDHIDGNPSNNCIDNLREVTYAGNARNQKKYKNNTSGCVGVKKHEGKWQAQIGTTPRHYLGSYDDYFEAVSARKSAENKHNYHVNHGRA